MHSGFPRILDFPEFSKPWKVLEFSVSASMELCV